MSVLEHFPMVSQLTAITSDGHPSENAQFDCVPASIGATLLWYMGKSQWDSDINPDRLKDSAVGQGVANMGTAASQYVPFVASLGYTLAPINGIPGQLVNIIHEQLARGMPVIITEPDPYVPSSYGWSHVCVAYADTSNTITVLDPYIGRPVTRSDNDWLNNLLFNQVWTIEKMEEDVPKLIELTDPEISRYYGLATPDGNAWVCRQTGKVVQGGILAFYRTFGGDAYCGLTYLGLPKSNEIPLSQGAKKQYFERAVVAYDPTTPHAIDNPPGAASIYLLQLYDDGPGTDPRVASLAPLQAQVTQLQAQLKAAGNSADTQKIAQIKAIVG